MGPIGFTFQHLPGACEYHMKPLLVIPPAPDRWPGLRGLPLDPNPLRSHDLERRFAHGVPGSQDAFAIIPDGGHILACAAVNKRHDVGVLNHVCTHPDHRGRGHSYHLIDTLLSWFDMAGGKWLYVTTTADRADGLFGQFGFTTIRQTACTPHDAVVMQRTAAAAPPDPLSTATGGLLVRDVTRANWPTMAVLLYNRPGPDPRVPLDESAVVAEVAALELITQQENGTCHLKAAFHGPRLVGLASVATDQSGDRTYAVLMPHDDTPPALRDAIVAFARSKGYGHIDFPMEGLTADQAGTPLVAQEPAQQAPPASKSSQVKKGTGTSQMASGHP